MNALGKTAETAIDALMLAPFIKPLISGTRMLGNEAAGLYNDLWENAALMGNRTAMNR